MKFPERYRSPHPLGFEHKQGDPFGWFMIPILPKGPILAVMADDQTEWGHVSVSLRGRCPTWDEMCYIKNLFFEKHETVVQYHPAESDYVNIAKSCLHLWHYKPGIPKPPKDYV